MFYKLLNMQKISWRSLYWTRTQMCSSLSQGTCVSSTMALGQTRHNVCPFKVCIFEQLLQHPSLANWSKIGFSGFGLTLYHIAKCCENVTLHVGFRGRRKFLINFKFSLAHKKKSSFNLKTKAEHFGIGIGPKFM